MYSANLPDTNHPEAADLNTRRTREVVSRLQQSELFKDYRRSYQDVTGLPLGIRAAGSFQSPLQDSKQINPFCALMASRNQTCASCLRLQQKIEERAVTEPVSLECFAGLTETAVPLRSGEQVIGYLQTGQVLTKPPTKAGFRRVLEQVKGTASGIDAKQLETTYFKTRVVARRQYEAVVRLLAIFGQQLASVVNQAMVSEASSEPPAIARSRAFISEHLTEELSLADVARAANMSAFYFCKMFKKATGVTFTDYVARVRIEGVKSLLLKPHVRVSEAAFEVGFQSLSQFNRVFRRIVGESPSDYRDRLHRSALTAA